MNDPVAWEPTLTALDAAKAAQGIRVGPVHDLATRLRSAGATYSLRYTPEVQAQRNRDVTEYQARERAAYELARASFESLDAEARALDPLTDAPIPYSYPESTTETASATLGGLLVTALAAGSFGNAITVNVDPSTTERMVRNMSPPPLSNVIALIQASTLTDPEKAEQIATLLAARQVQYTAAESHFALRVARGRQVETFDNMTVGALPSKPSELVVLEWVGNQRPVSKSLTGGRGGAFAALGARIDRLAARNAREATSMRSRLQGITPRIQPLAYSPPFGGPPLGTAKTLPSIQSVENELVKAIAEAEAWLAG
jgi:hypothetical protein